MAEEDIHLPPLTLLQQTSLVLAQLGDLPCDAAAAELTCISEEGIADVNSRSRFLDTISITVKPSFVFIDGHSRPFIRRLRFCG